MKLLHGFNQIRNAQFTTEQIGRIKLNSPVFINNCRTKWFGKLLSTVGTNVLHTLIFAKK